MARCLPCEREAKGYGSTTSNVSLGVVVVAALVALVLFARWEKSKRGG